MERLPINKKDTWLRNLGPWRKKGGRAGKTKTTWDEQNKHHWENLELILRMGRMMGSSWRETRRLEGINMTTSMIKKDYHPHRNMRTPLRIRYGINTCHWSNSNTTNKTKQRIGLQNKPEQTYDRDFVRSFHGGAHTGSIVQHHHVQGSAHDIRSVPESA